MIVFVSGAGSGRGTEARLVWTEVVHLGATADQTTSPCRD